MKRYLFLLLITLFHLSSYAQESVLGIKFGWDYLTVKKKLEDRYGKYNVHDDNNNLKVFDIQVGDYFFHLGSFDFQNYQNSTFFYYAEFQNHFSVDSPSEAKKFRDDLKTTLKKKYGFVYEWTNKQGYKCYDFSKLDPEIIQNPSCSVTVEKAKSRSGKLYIYVTLFYGPRYFVDETSDF